MGTDGRGGPDLVNFNSAVDGEVKGEGGEEADGTGGEEEGEGDDGHVRKVEKGGSGSGDGKVGNKVPDGVGEEIDGG